MPVFSEGFKRNATVAAVNVETGEYTLFTNKNTKWGDDWAMAAIASGSVPGVLQPAKINGSYYMDGGTVWNVNIGSAIEGCLEIVDDISKINIDIVFCTTGRNEHPIPETSPRAWENWLRAKEISHVHSGHDSIIAEMRAYPTANWRYLFMEPGGAGGAQQLNFNPETTWPVQLLGREKALEALEYGPGFGFDSLTGSTKKESPSITEKLQAILRSIF